MDDGKRITGYNVTVQVQARYGKGQVSPCTTDVVHEAAASAEGFDDALRVADALANDAVQLMDAREAVQTLFDFYGMDTNAFVVKYGRGVTTKDCCDRLRRALGMVNVPEASSTKAAKLLAERAATDGDTD